MTVGPELLGLATMLAGQWIHSWRRSQRSEARQVERSNHLLDELSKVRDCLDDAQAKLAVYNERLARIEGRMQEREMRWEEHERGAR